MNSWTVQVEEDKTTGELVLPLPADLLNQMGWAEGTELFWIDNHNGTFSITNRNPDELNDEIPSNNDVGC